MRVKDLIKKLEQLNPNDRVFLSDDFSWGCLYKPKVELFEYKKFKGVLLTGDYLYESD